jgi:hypothetical protein
MRTRTVAALASLLVLLPYGLAQAQEHHDRDRRDFRDFHGHVFEAWRGGRWIHVGHEGRFGWWWVVGDFWYFYPAPIYPYPDPYVPPGIVVPVAPPGAPPAPQYWYYCANPAGYFPYVPQCGVAWQPVAPQPQPPPPPQYPPPAAAQPQYAPPPPPPPG